MSEAPTVYCPKEKKAVPVWYCLGSWTQNRQQCPDLIKATVHGGEAIIPFKERSGDTVHMNVNFNVNAIDSQDVARFFEANKGLIAKQVASAAERSQAFRMRLR